jgi:hypothetical protein
MDTVPENIEALQSALQDAVRIIKALRRGTCWCWCPREIDSFAYTDHAAWCCDARDFVETFSSKEKGTAKS